MAPPTTGEFRSSKDSAALQAQPGGTAISSGRAPGAASRGRQPVGALVIHYWLMSSWFNTAHQEVHCFSKGYATESANSYPLLLTKVKISDSYRKCFKLRLGVSQLWAWNWRHWWDIFIFEVVTQYEKAGWKNSVNRFVFQWKYTFKIV